jgi:hypothetical protein
MAENFKVDVSAFPWWQRLSCNVLSLIQTRALAHGLNHLRQLFIGYAQQDYFSTAAAVHLGKLGHGVLPWVGLKVLTERLLSLWMTLRAGPGNPMLSLSFQESDVAGLFLAACMAVIAHILKQASDLKAEHRQFI